MPWQIAWKPSAARTFDNLPADVQERTMAAIARLALTERGDLRRMEGTSIKQWRLRVGDYRVLLAQDDEASTLLIMHLGPRGSVYRG